jgi:Tfp pilus assembly protein PilO
MKTKNLAVGALAGALVLALWWNFLLKPTQSKAKAVKADTELQRAKLQPLETQLAQAHAYQAHASEFKAQLAVLQQAVPESPALAAFIRDANAIGDASRVSWQSVTHGPPTPADLGMESIPVVLTVRGTYEQVMEYLGRIAALKRLLVIDGVQATAAATGSTTPGAPADGSGASTGPFSGASELTVTLTARMFEIPPGLAAAAAGTDASAVTTPASTG